jgi:tetratricopeptide (TPR) repeat protein
MSVHSQTSGIERVIDLVLGSKDKRNRFAIFCGAGISKNSGLPQANALECSILENLEMEKEDREGFVLTKRPFEAFMETISDNLDISDLLKLFTLAKPNSTHRLIAILAKMGIVQMLITTNFDNCIEQAFEMEGLRKGIDYDTIYNETDFDKFKSRGKEVITLIKIHGTAENIPSVRTTLKQIAARALSMKRAGVLRDFFSDYSTNTVLIMGYSCSDIFDITPILEAIKEPRNRVLFIDHVSHLSIPEIENIGMKQDNNPFKKFKGERIKVDTDLFVSAMSDALRISLNPEKKDKMIDWQNYVNVFFKNVKERDPSLQYALSGQLLVSNMQIKSAIKYYEKALEISHKIGFAFGIARSSSQLAICYDMLGKHDKAISFVNRTIEISDLNRSAEQWLGARMNLATYYYNSGRLEEGFKLAKQILNESKQLNEIKLLAGSYELLGRYYNHIGNAEEALSNLKTALPLFESEGDINAQISCLGNIAGCFQSKRNYKESIEIYNRSLKLSIDLGNPLYIAKCYSSIGSCYRALADPKEALLWLSKARNVLQDSGLLGELGYCLREMAIVLSDLGNPERSVELYEEAVSCFEKTGDKDGIIRTLGEIGVFHLNYGRTKQAMEYYNRALNFVNGLEDTSTVAWLYRNLAGCFAKDKDFKNANFYLDQAVRISDTIRDKDGQEQAVKLRNLISRDSENIQGLRRTSIDQAKRRNRHENQIDEMNYNFEKARFSLKMGNLADYERYFEKAHKIAANINRNDYPLSELLTTAHAYYKSGDLEGALKFAERALEYYDLTDNKEQRSALMVTLSKLYLDRKEPGKGLEFALRGIKEASTGGLSTNLMGAKVNAGLCLIALQRIDEALMNLKDAEMIATTEGKSKDLVGIQKILKGLI